MSGNRVTTYHRTSYESILNDSDYQSALKNADSEAKSIYQDEAEKIDKIQKRILS